MRDIGNSVLESFGFFPRLRKARRPDRRLGSGGMGIVYQAYDRVRQETVALKRWDCWELQQVTDANRGGGPLAAAHRQPRRKRR